jgi:hypothetical protein
MSLPILLTCCTWAAYAPAARGLGRLGPARAAAVLTASTSPPPAGESALERWLHAAHGVDLSRVRVGDAPAGKGRGLFAARECEAGETLFEIPLEACICDETILSEPGPFGDALRAIADDGDGLLVATVALLLKERGLGARSAWAAYVEALPWTHTFTARISLLYWTDAQLETWLRGSSAAAEAIELRAAVAAAAAMLRAVFEGVGMALPSVEPVAPLAPAAASAQFADACTAAFALVLSRAFPFGGAGDTVLVPLLDMANSASAEAAAQPYELTDDAAAVAMRARRPLAAGAEVENTYGRMSAAERLVVFGILDDDDMTPEGRGVRLTLALDEADAELAWKRALLTRCGRVDHEREPWVLLPLAANEPPLPEELRALLRLKAIAPDDAPLRRALDAAEEPWELLMSDEPISEAGDAAADALDQRSAQLLRAELEAALARYPPAAEADAAAADALVTGPLDAARLALARRLIAAEQSTLRSLIFFL